MPSVKGPSAALAPLPDLTRDASETAELASYAETLPMDLISDALRHARDRHKALDAQRKNILEPLAEAQKRINALFAPVLTKLKTVETILRGRVVQHEAEARRAAQEALEAAARAAAVGAPVAPALEAHDAAVGSVPSRDAGVSYRRSWSYEVTDPGAVPREFCCPDLNRIGEAVRKSGEAADIPGVRVFEKVIPVVR